MDVLTENLLLRLAQLDDTTMIEVVKHLASHPEDMDKFNEQFDRWLVGQFYESDRRAGHDTFPWTTTRREKAAARYQSPS